MFNVQNLNTGELVTRALDLKPLILPNVSAAADLATTLTVKAILAGQPLGFVAVPILH